MKASFSVLFLVVVAGWLLPIERSWSQTKSGSNSSQVANTERKLEHLERNADLDHPDPAPTEFTEQEINAYFASGNVKLPPGVQSVVFQEQPQIVIGTSRVDFDQVKAGKNSYNPLLSMFSGLHDVIVIAHAHGARGVGIVHVDSVSIDGVEVPKFVLELFLEKYLKPRYPNIGIDSRFALPVRVDAAAVGLHKVSVSQK
jgi:hypothetical protein